MSKEFKVEGLKVSVAALDYHGNPTWWKVLEAKISKSKTVKVRHHGNQHVPAEAFEQWTKNVMEACL